MGFSWLQQAPNPVIFLPKDKKRADCWHGLPPSVSLQLARLYCISPLGTNGGVTDLQAQSPRHWALHKRNALQDLCWINLASLSAITTKQNNQNKVLFALEVSPTHSSSPLHLCDFFTIPWLHHLKNTLISTSGNYVPQNSSPYNRISIPVGDTQIFTKDHREPRT